MNEYMDSSGAGTGTWVFRALPEPFPPPHLLQDLLTQGGLVTQGEKQMAGAADKLTANPLLSAPSLFQEPARNAKAPPRRTGLSPPARECRGRGVAMVTAGPGAAASTVPAGPPARCRFQSLHFLATGELHFICSSS